MLTRTKWHPGYVSYITNHRIYQHIEIDRRSINLLIIFPMQVRTVFLNWLPWVLRMSRPCDKDESSRKPTGGPAANSKQIKDIEMKERSSRSLLANVLDIDDDFRQHSCTLSSVGSGMALSMGGPSGFPRVVATPSGGLTANQGKSQTLSKVYQTRLYRQP